MAARQPARERAGETISEFMDRRRREAAASNAGSHATAHQAYGRAIRNGVDLSLPHPSDVTAHGAHLVREAAKPKSAPPQPTRIGHPGFAESLIPVWGSAREAAADFQEGRYAAGALNAALALSDLGVASALANTVRKAAVKGGMKGALFVIKGAVGDSPKATVWKNVRRELGDKGVGLLEKHQHGHHWAIPQNAKRVPEAVLNHPLNIHGVPKLKEATSAEVHGRLHGRYKGKPRFGPMERYVHGTPHWSKAATASVAGHTAAAHSGKHRR